MFYLTPTGKSLFEKYLGKLAQRHKDDDVAEILNYISKLSEFGFDINEKFKPNDRILVTGTNEDIEKMMKENN